MAEPQQAIPDNRSAVEIAVVGLLIVAFLTVSMLCQNPFAKDANVLKAIGTIVAAGVTLIMFSFLYRDNVFFKIAENLYVGVALGYSAIRFTWEQSLRPEVVEPLYNAPTSSAFLYELLHRAVPIILGLLLLTRLSRKYGWMSRYSYAIMIGWGSGIAIQTTTHSFVLAQLHAAIVPFQETVASGAFSASFASWEWWSGVAFPIFGALVMMIGTVSGLWYFFFSVEHKGVGKKFSQLGVLFLMVSFGASFGYTVMGRISLLIGRVQFLLNDWLNIAR